MANAGCFRRTRSYVGTANQLAGCHNDARNMAKFITERYQYRTEDIVILLDAPGINYQDPSYPSRQNMVSDDIHARRLFLKEQY